ncbi:unnamed protein product [Rotaria socialis]|uniref:Endonuclease/exonuclease/phosphatase domain-containing protein n=2 Tax=Rotaria socialis TaxID=392032 RepID=A0A818T208_9BILA|nr:unnamed protein product [Rotaria socialis]
MNGYNQTPYRLGRRPGKQGPRPLPGNQGRVEKLATGKTDVMTRTKDTNRGTGVTTIKTNDGAQRLKITKDIFTVGTWNVQTLWTTGKLELLRNEMKRFRFDVVGISEVRWTGKGETPRGDFIWSGENTTHTKGVGLLLSTKAKKAMIGYNPISSRLISVRFNATPFKITVIHVYALTSASSEDEIEAFYENIEKELSRTSKKDLIIITGDWNTKVGSDNTNWENTMGKYGYGDRNERGERLLEFAALHNFYICNTRFQQKPNRKWTWISPNGVHKNMIDLILIQKRWKSSVMNCRTFQSADISSDHSLVLCNIKLRLKQRQIKPQQNHRFEINQLKNQATKKLYQEKLNANLQRIIETDSIDEHVTKIERAIEEALQTTITTTKRAKNPWISEQTLNLADEKRRVKQIKSISTQNAKLYKDLCNRVRKSARQDKEKWIRDKCDEIEKGLNVGNTRQAYSLIKTLKKKFVPRTTAIKNEDGTMAQSKDNVKERWTQYCSDLYKDDGGGDEIVRELENISPSYQDDSQDILYSEVNQAIQTLKSNKSPGSDGITAEMIQAGGEQLIHQIHALCNKAWNQGAIPKEWGKSILVPIPKKGDLNECSNYRTISLINHTSKILLIILLNRLKYRLDPYLAEEQAGFRKDRSTVQQILTLRLLAEKAKRQGIKISIIVLLISERPLTPSSIISYGPF